MITINHSGWSYIELLSVLWQLPGVDVVDHGAEGAGVLGADADLSLPGLLHLRVVQKIFSDLYDLLKT